MFESNLGRKMLMELDFAESKLKKNYGSKLAPFKEQKTGRASL